MYLETRLVRGKRKYYLSYSYREGDKPRKIRIYLGSNLSKTKLQDEMKAAEARMKSKIVDVGLDPYNTVISANELEELRSLVPSDNIRLMHLSEQEWLRFTENFTYDTNAIEGSTLERSQVTDILERNKWPAKSKEEISETFGVSEAVRYIRSNEDHLSIELIKELHRTVFRNSKPFAGQFRKAGEEVAVVNRLGEVIHRGAPSKNVTKLLKNLVSWYRRNKKKYPPLVLAAVIHNQFENIHPFVDGNGRVGRLLLINILIKHNLPPVNIELENRSEYYASLQAYQLNGNMRPTIELLLKEYKRLKKSIARRR